MKSVVKSYIQPSFLICIAVLALAGVGKSVTIRWLKVELTKLSLPLKKSLDLIDESKLAPYKVIRKAKIDNPDIVEALGTHDYIQWKLEDTEVAEFSPVRYCSLFITYYTGNPDMVPHVPDECYVGAGNQRLGMETVVLNVGGLVATDDQSSSRRATDRQIETQYVVFVKKSSDMWQASAKYAVLYFFKANNEYAGSRTKTREIMGRNFFVKYSYFSKVEWRFRGGTSDGVIEPTKAEVLKASEKLLSVFLPVMESEHRPDWPKARGDG